MKNDGGKLVGLGDRQFTFAVYIGNRPAMPEYQSLVQLLPMQENNIDLIGRVCGNGWRKVFNVYAKLLYELNTTHFNFATMAPTWQQYRDQYLLQANSGTALIFSPPHLPFTSISLQAAFSETYNKTDKNNNTHNKTIHIICGRTYAKKLINDGLLNADLVWLDEEFAIDAQQAVIICPYFDYRQLSNQKIQRLSTMLSAVVNEDK